MKPQYEEARQRVENSCRFWRSKLDLSHLSFSDRFLETVKEDEEDVVADTESNWEYRAVVMRWFLPKLCQLTAEEIEHDVLHEHVHALVASMESELSSRHTKACEYAVESVTRAILHLTEQ